MSFLHYFDYLLFLNEGSHGKVLTGPYKKDGHDRALKVFNMSDEGQSIECLRELSILEFLDHPNIIHRFDILREDAVIGIVMENMSRNLHEDMKARNDYNIRLGFAKQLLNGLMYLHEQEIMHRDLKSENILIDEADGLRIADFGHSRFYKTKNHKYTIDVCTPHYRCIEIWEKNDHYTIDVDIWSIGCIFYELSENVLLFEDKETDEDWIEQLRLFLDDSSKFTFIKEPFKKILTLTMTRTPRPKAESLFKMIMETF